VVILAAGIELTKVVGPVPSIWTSKSTVQRPGTPATSAGIVAPVIETVRDPAEVVTVPPKQVVLAFGRLATLVLA
jgi:hypothetical protein